MSASEARLIEQVCSEQIKRSVPEFRTGDTVRVHAKIVEGQKERVQIFEGLVIKRHKGNLPSATFTVRKVSYNIGVERTFLLHSPRIERLEVIAKGHTRRARLFHLRPLRGKAAKIKSTMVEAALEEPNAVSDTQTSAETATESSPAS